MYVAPSVEIVFFQRHLDVVRYAERVDTSPGYWIRLPPTVKRTRCVSYLLGQMSTTNCPYVITVSLGTALRGIKKGVLKPSILPQTPFASRPNSFAAAVFQTGNVFSSWMRWRYSRLAPVSSLMTALVMGMVQGDCVMGIAAYLLLVKAMGRKMRCLRV
jgi:hypothetical protein